MFYRQFCTTSVFYIRIYIEVLVHIINIDYIIYMHMH